MIIICVFFEITLFIFWYVYCYFQCGKTSILFTSAEIIVPFIYLMYSVIAPIFFVIEGKSLADRYFYISYDDMCKTCLLYLGIYFLFLVMLFFDDAGNRLFKRKTDWAIHCKYKTPAIWWDSIAIVILLYYVLRIIAVGRGWNQLGTLEKRNVVSSGFVTYLNIYMVAYSSKLIITLLLNKETRTRNNYFRVAIPVVFWCVYLFVTSRRYFLMLFPALFIAIVASEARVNISFRWIRRMGTVAILLLAMGAKRAFLTLSKGKSIYFLHNMFAEFNYTYYTSCYFIGNNYEKQYGRTYIWETLTQWIPRAIYPNKHIDISIRFWEMARTNVAYSFNPVAEGLYNFGWGAIIVVPIVLLLYVKFSNYIKKYSYALYMVAVGSFIGFMRGNLSNCVMDVVMIILLYLLMNFDGVMYRIYVDKAL